MKPAARPTTIMPGAPRFVLFIYAICVAVVAGCFSSTAFEAHGSHVLVIAGYAYDGQNVRTAEGELKVKLDNRRNTGAVHATVRDVLETIDIRFANFTGRLPYQSGGVARNLHLWGDTGNGSTVFPKVYVYAAAFGYATLDIDGEPQRDPTNLRQTLPAYFFLTRGVYRDPDTHLVYSSEPGRPYDPAKPTESTINQIGAQATLLLYTSRGTLHRHVEFRDVIIDRLD